MMNTHGAIVHNRVGRMHSMNNNNSNNNNNQIKIIRGGPSTRESPRNSVISNFHPMKSLNQNQLNKIYEQYEGINTRNDQM